MANEWADQFKAAVLRRVQEMGAARADAVARIAADLDRDMEAAGIDPDDDTPLAKWNPYGGNPYGDPRVTDKPLASLGMVRRITNDLKAAATQPDENGMTAFPVHPDSPLAMGDPVAAAIADLPMVVPGVTVLINPRNLPPAPETPVTPEMIAAATSVLEANNGLHFDALAAAIYRAMDAHRPMELTSEAEDALRLENAILENTILHDALDERIAAYQELMDIALEHRDLIAARDARIRELDDMLAQRPAPVPDTPKPVHDWTRVEGGDRRMLGR